MTTTVLRYRCDLCGKLHLLERIAIFCEAMCAEDAAAQVGRNAERQDTAEWLGPKDEHAFAAGDAPNLQQSDNQQEDK